MKILLINPPSHVPTTIPPTGLCYISSALKRQGHDVTGIDAAALNNRLSIQDVAKRAKLLKPDLIGVSLNIYFIRGGYELVNQLKALNIPIVAGGPHAQVRPEEVLDAGFDFVVASEGEEAIIDIVSVLEGKISREGIKGIGYKDEQHHARFNEPRELISDLDKVPFLDRDLFPMDHYYSDWCKQGGNFWYPFFTSRGCPFQCTFCVVHDRKARRRSVSNVLAEMKALKDKYSVKRIMIFDDLFTLQKKWLFELFDAMESSGLSLEWQCESRIDTLDKEMATRMKQAGCKGLWFGIESGDSETLKKINKRISLEKIDETMGFVSELDFQNVKINFMLGFPWEKKTHLDNSFKLIKKYTNKLKAISGIAVPIPYPGTQLYEEYRNIYGFSDWWLKKDAFEKIPLDFEQTPYFKQNSVFAFQIRFWLEKDFFKYPKKFKRYLYRTVIRSEKLIYYSSVGWLKTEVIYYLSWLSYFLFKIDSRLEKVFFKFIKLLKRCQAR